MYLAHFGLQEMPFGITPDTAFFYPGSSAQQALNTLLVACDAGEGFVKITGEVGAGKTLLCRKLLSLLQAPQHSQYCTAYIPNPMMDPRSLLFALADEIGLQLPERADQHLLFKAINSHLLKLGAQGKRLLLCMDEAQSMPLPTLEALRLLSNLETEKRKLLQIVLFGQPELEHKLARREIRQLTQRISFQYHLQAMPRDEMRAYLAHRIAHAGGNPHLMQSGAADAIWRASRGIARVANLLAHKSLLAAYGMGAPQVQKQHVRRAVADTPASHSFWPRAWLRWI
ncbi:AAA family ATPase [Massilia sp. W12]|uniref:ExeA family protein n=1 Tax=Massilia sp. W12 TaxID=3126507 RepID=UPI0030CABC8A